MKNLSSILLLMGIGAVSLSACHGMGDDPSGGIETNARKEKARVSGGQEDQFGASISSSRASTGADPVIVIPGKYVLKKSRIVVSGENWQSTLNALPSDERNFLVKKNNDYFDSLEFDDVEELKAMAKQGFPLPEDWIDAADMTTDELRALGEAGSMKARMLYADRLIEEAVRYLPQRERNPQAYDSGEGFKAGVLAYAELGKLKSESSSPFVAYMDGRLQYSLNTQPSPETIAGAMFAASQRGDQRADALLQAFVSSHPNLDVARILAAYKSLKSTGG
ncbi:hypothetical protein GCM10027084_11650 [Pseudoxanthomonas sangjuensis]|uniref:hypothetical protein n=1 Tax=Pseudoxanthomonas sangjuensis TaxID=1503750 RepID=UPI001391462C|nr:hypothetical protein [Pseudoxanthomonas sangjuensis]